MVPFADLAPDGPVEGEADENYPHCMVSSAAYRQMARAWLLFSTDSRETSINPSLTSVYAVYVLAAVLSGARSEWPVPARAYMGVVRLTSWPRSLKMQLDRLYPDVPKRRSEYLAVKLPPSWYPWWATYRSAYPRLRSGTLAAVAAAGVLRCVECNAYLPTPDEWQRLCQVLPLEPLVKRYNAPPIRHRRQLY